MNFHQWSKLGEISHIWLWCLLDLELQVKLPANKIHSKFLVVYSLHFITMDTFSFLTGGLLYVIFQELFSSSSPSKIYGKAFNKCKTHPEVRVSLSNLTVALLTKVCGQLIVLPEHPILDNMCGYQKVLRITCHRSGHYMSSIRRIDAQCCDCRKRWMSMQHFGCGDD